MIKVFFQKARANDLNELPQTTKFDNSMLDHYFEPFEASLSKTSWAAGCFELFFDSVTRKMETNPGS